MKARRPCKRAVSASISGTGILSLFALDSDDSGKINARELQEALEAMDVWLSVAQLKHLLGSIDTDQDGSIVYDELEKWMAIGGRVGGRGGEMLAVASPSPAKRPSSSSMTSTRTVVEMSTSRSSDVSPGPSICT